MTRPDLKGLNFEVRPGVSVGSRSVTCVSRSIGQRASSGRLRSSLSIGIQAVQVLASYRSSVVGAPTTVGAVQATRSYSSIVEDVATGHLVAGRGDRARDRLDELQATVRSRLAVVTDVLVEH